MEHLLFYYICVLINIWVDDSQNTTYVAYEAMMINEGLTESACHNKT